MSYTLEVTMQNREGAMTRLVLLLSQRHLDIAKFTSNRKGAGTIVVMVEVDGPEERAEWALRQISRNHNVIAARIYDRPDPGCTGSRPWKHESAASRPYPVRGNTPNRRRTLVLRREARLETAKS
jgi:hypothetical protein